MDKVNTTIETVLSSIDEKNNFVLEAGAGSGKTYTLIQTLLHLRNSELKQGQKILCVTFTNVAKDEIIERLESTGKSDKYTISTMHDFLWGFLVKFQGELQKEVKRLAEENKQKLKDELSEAVRKIGNPRGNVNIKNQEKIIEINTMRLEKYKDIDYTSFPIKYDVYSAYYKGIISHDDIISIANT